MRPENTPLTPRLPAVLHAIWNHAAECGELVVPRPFRNMRASCVTEWAEALPAHVVAKWPGHSPLVAAKRELQTRGAHFEVAIRGGARLGSGVMEQPFRTAA